MVLKFHDFPYSQSCVSYKVTTHLSITYLEFSELCIRPQSCPFYSLFSCEQSKRKADVLLKDFIVVHINKLLIGHLAKRCRNLCKSQ